LISVALGAAILAFIYRVAIPWYQRAVFHGPQLQGVWHCRYDSSELPDDQTIEVRQYGRRLRGTLTVHRWADRSIANLSVPVTGQIEGHQVIITGVHAASGTCGASLLEIREAASEMVGFIVCTEPANNQVRSFRRRWIRESVIVPK
jgi:hypothetical protein